MDPAKRRASYEDLLRLPEDVPIFRTFATRLRC